MCGACARLTPDWARPLVSGPNRRADIARFLSLTVRGLTIKALPQGWSVANRTGSTWPVSSLDDLLERVAKFNCVTEWTDLEQLILRVPGRAQHEEYGHYIPGPLLPHEVRAPAVLSPGNGSEHVRLAAFGLGVRTFERKKIALDFPNRAAPFTLVAAEGKILGSVALSQATHGIRLSVRN